MSFCCYCVGITFFGVENQDNIHVSPGIFTLFTLAPPSAERIRRLQEFLDHPELIKHEFLSQPTRIITCPLKVVPYHNYS